MEEARALGQGSDPQGHGRDHRTHHRHHDGAALGLRAGCLHPRHHGRAVPPVRHRRLGLDADLGDQRPVARTGLVLRPPDQEPRAAARARGLDAGRHRPDDGGLCAWVVRGWSGSRSSLAGILAGTVFLIGVTFKATRRASCRRRTRAPSSPSCNCRRASQNRTATTAAEMDEIIRREPAVESVTAVIGSISSTPSPPRTRPSSSSA